jgi:hypothetical protein
MTTGKLRLTVTVDPDLVQAGNEAVSSGRAESLSAWVNLALAERVVRERRLRALGEAIAAYEAEFGAITDAELVTQQRADRASARVVRGPAPIRTKRRRARRRAA